MMLLPRMSEVLFEELEAARLPADQAMVERGVDLVERYGVPNEEWIWRLLVMDDLATVVDSLKAVVVEELEAARLPPDPSMVASAMELLKTHGVVDLETWRYRVRNGIEILLDHSKAVVLEELKRAKLPADEALVASAMNLLERTVPHDTETWRRLVREEVRVFTPNNLSAALRILRDA